MVKKSTPRPRKTDWPKVEATTDAEIDRQIEEDGEKPLDKEWFEQASRTLPEPPGTMDRFALAIGALIDEFRADGMTPEAMAEALSFELDAIVTEIEPEPPLSEWIEQARRTLPLDIWAGLRPAVRHRLTQAVQRLKLTGRLNRSDLMEFGEVTTAQASVDLREIQKRCPGLMRYDRSRKTYLLRSADDPAMVP